MSSEDRKSPRKALRCQAILALSGVAPMRVRTQDISLGGMCVMVPEQVPPGSACMIAFDAPLHGRIVRVTGVAKVVYSILSSTDGFRTGLQFVQLDAANAKALADLLGG